MSDLPPRPSPDPFGLTILIEPAVPDGEHIPLTNVIFVHGLGGSARGTWTHEESDSFWPDWLPTTKGLGHARIMTFGYDADWNKIWRPNNVLDISDFGDQLLNHLLLHYSSFGDVSLSLVEKFPLINCVGSDSFCCAQHGRTCC